MKTNEIEKLESELERYFMIAGYFENPSTNITFVNPPTQEELNKVRQNVISSNTAEINDIKKNLSFIIDYLVPFCPKQLNLSKEILSKLNSLDYIVK